MGEDFFITYPVVVQKYGQVLNEESSLLLLRSIQAVGRSKPSVNPLPDISMRQLMEQHTHVAESYKTSSLIQLVVVWE